MDALRWLQRSVSGVMVRGTRASARVPVLLVIAATLLAVFVAPAGSSVSRGSARATAQSACTDSWTNAGGGDWSDSGNWSSGVPTSASQVCITLAGTYTVEITAADGTETVAGFTIGGASGTQTLQIDVSAQLTVNGTSSNQANGAISNQGTFLVPTNQAFNEGAGTTSGNAITISNAFLNFTGGGGAASFVITNVGSTNVTGSTSSVESVELVSASVSWAGPSTNAGTISAAGGSSLLSVPGGTLTNTGLIRAEAGDTGTFTLSGSVASSGSIVDNSAMALPGGSSLTNTGLVLVAAGATFGYGGTVSNNAGGSISNGGSFTGTSNTVFNEGAGTTSGNAITISNAFLNFTGGGGSSAFALTNVGSSDVTGTIAAGQTLILQSGATEGGSLTNNGTIDAQSTGAGTSINGFVVNNGTFHAESGHPTTITGNYSQGSAGVLTVDIGDAGNFGRLAISGTATLDGQLNVATSGFTPNAGDTFAVVHSTGARTGQFAGYTFTGQLYTTQYPADGVTLVAADPLVVATTSLPSGLAGTPYPGATLASSGGTGTVTWSVPPDSLPPGLSLNSTTGAITGTPTIAGTTSFTVTATDSGVPSQPATMALSITIVGAPPTLTGIEVTPANPTIVNGTNQQFTATGTYSDASTADITSSVTWASNTPTVATISSGGLAHAVSQGSSTITATLGAVSGHTLLTVGPAPNRPPTVSAGGPYSVAEGGSVTLAATGSDPDGDPLTYAWDLDGNGTFETSGQTPTFTAGDGPATQTVTVRATDPSGASATASSVVTISNVAPIATFNAPGTAAAGSTFTPSLTSPNDPSAADTTAGFQYAFDCGSGYGAFSTASTRTCTAATAGPLSVGGKIRDKDGGVSEYRATVTITALNPYDQVCALARAYSSQRLVADAVCAELAAARQEAAHGHVLFKQIDLVLAQITVALESGRAFTHAEANQLIRLIQAL